jgi:hypothetical protein
MLIPRYSLRWLLALITAAGAVSLVLSYAFPPRSHHWAIAVTAGLGSLVLLMTMYALTFLTAWVVSQLEQAIFGSPGGGGASPFAVNPPPSPFGPPEPGLSSNSEAPPPMTG